MELMDVRVGDVREVGPQQDAVPEVGEPPRSAVGKGLNPSLKSVNAIVVSSLTSGYASASARNSAYSGIPMCATTSRSRGWRASSRPIGSGPVYAPGSQAPTRSA